MPPLHMLDLKTPAGFVDQLPPDITDLLGYAWSSDDLYTFGATSYRYVQSHTGVHHFVAHDGTGDPQLLTDAQLAQFIEAGEYGRKTNYFAGNPVAKLRNVADQLVSDLPEKDQAKINFACNMVWGVQRLVTDIHRPSDELLQNALLETYETLDKARRKKTKSGEKVFAFRQPALSTWKSWRDRLAACGNAPIALYDLRGAKSGNRLPRFGGELLQMISASIRGYLSEKRPTVVTVYDQLLIALFKQNKERAKAGLTPLKAPHISTVYAHIAKIDKYIKDALREGIDVANRRYRATGKGLGVVRPGSRTEIDGWTIDLHTLVSDSKFFPELTDDERKKLKSIRLVVIVLIDAATRCVTGLHVCTNENGESAIAAMRMSVEPKNELARRLGCNSPWPMISTSGLVSDNGVFASEFVQAIAKDAFGAAMLSPLGVPWMRPIIERFFRTMSVQLMAHFTGRSFGSIREKGDYQAEKRASINIEELLEALIRYVVDVYHHTEHSTLGMTPYMAWQVLGEKFPPFPPMDKERIAAIFGIRLTRHVYGDGVVFWNQWYNSPTLQRVMRRIGIGKELPIKVDPENMGQIVVEVPVDKYGRADGEGPFDRKGWIEVHGPEELQGVTIWQFEAAVHAFHAKYGDAIKEGQRYRLEALEFLASLGEEAAKQRLVRVAYSPAHLEEAAKGFFPGLRQKENAPSNDELAELHSRSRKGAQHLAAAPEPLTTMPVEKFEINFDEE